jgi:hypothetical protein
MAKTLYIHIGHYKTGTTALQIFAVRNAAVLARGNVAYSQNLQNNAKQSILAFSLFHHAGVKTLMHGYAKPETPESVWGRLFDEMRASPMEKMLVSSEELMRLAEFPETVERLRRIVTTEGRDFDYKVVVYLRPPADQVASWYNQMVKMRQPIGDFDSALASRHIEAVQYDYACALAPWVDIFGKDNVILRPYPSRASPPETLLIDFCRLMGIELSAEEARQKADPNPRLDDRMLEVVRLAQNAGTSRETIDGVRDRIATYVQRQERLRARGDGINLAQTHADAGLARLAEMTGEDLAYLSGPIAPRPVGPDVEAVPLQIGFLETEIAALQARVATLEPARKQTWRTRVKKLFGR